MVWTVIFKNHYDAMIVEVIITDTPGYNKAKAKADEMARSQFQGSVIALIKGNHEVYV